MKKYIVILKQDDVDCRKISGSVSSMSGDIN